MPTGILQEPRQNPQLVACCREQHNGRTRRALYNVFLRFELGVLVACPFFMPEQPLDGDWPFPQRLPLGAGWSGTCRAAAGSEARPSDQELRTCCNIGHAKTCTRLPADRHADAVRFALGDERDGKLLVRYACEREHVPVSHGDLVYEIAGATWTVPHPDSCLQRMAECYVEGQMARRRSREL